jgi:hypothetical protein
MALNKAHISITLFSIVQAYLRFVLTHSLFNPLSNSENFVVRVKLNQSTALTLSSFH